MASEFTPAPPPPPASSRCRRLAGPRDRPSRDRPRLPRIHGSADRGTRHRRRSLVRRCRNPDAAKLAAALGGELASAERLHELVAQTERTLRRLVSQLNDAVNRAAEVAFAPDGAGFDGLVDQLESLRQALAEAQAHASVDTV